MYVVCQDSEKCGEMPIERQQENLLTDASSYTMNWWCNGWNSTIGTLCVNKMINSLMTSRFAKRRRPNLLKKLTLMTRKLLHYTQSASLKYLILTRTLPPIHQSATDPKCKYAYSFNLKNMLNHYGLSLPQGNVCCRQAATAVLSPHYTDTTGPHPTTVWGGQLPYLRILSTSNLQQQIKKIALRKPNID